MLSKCVCLFVCWLVDTFPVLVGVISTQKPLPFWIIYPAVLLTEDGHRETSNTALRFQKTVLGSVAN